MGSEFTPQFAYNPEGLAIEIKNAQRFRHLYKVNVPVISFPQVVEELGVEWVILDSNTFYAGNCDINSMMRLHPGDEISIIQSSRLSRAPLHKEKSFPIALVTSEDSILYHNPGFDLGKYKAQQL